MEYIQVLKSTALWITIIMGTGLTVLGIGGASANLAIFSRPRFRKTACGQYILLESLIDLVYIGFILVARIVVDVFNPPTFFASDFVCKLRNYLGTFLSGASIWCKCLTAFDRWASTSRNANIRQWSNVKRAHILLLIIIILWSSVSSPNIVLSYSSNANVSWQCVLSNTIYIEYYAYFLYPIGIFLLPLLIFSFFGFRTYIHISRLTAFRRGQLFDRQLTRMILYQAFVTIITSLPYGAQFFYTTLTATWNKNSLWLAIDSVIIQTGRMFVFVNSASGFYIYVSTSKVIQSMIKKSFKKLFTNNHQRNLVVPFHNNENLEMRQIRH
jgi:hypothetical protein